MEIAPIRFFFLIIDHSGQFSRRSTNAFSNVDDFCFVKTAALYLHQVRRIRIVDSMSQRAEAVFLIQIGHRTHALRVIPNPDTQLVYPSVFCCGVTVTSKVCPSLQIVRHSSFPSDAATCSVNCFFLPVLRRPPLKCNLPPSTGILPVPFCYDPILRNHFLRSQESPRF